VAGNHGSKYALGRRKVAEGEFESVLYRRTGSTGKGRMKLMNPSKLVDWVRKNHSATMTSCKPCPV
jgi:hypothetical protein